MKRRFVQLAIAITAIVTLSAFAAAAIIAG
jgi:hypothetical protein